MTGIIARNGSDAERDTGITDTNGNNEESSQGIVWVIIYNVFYSREAQVKRLLKGMYKLPIKFSRRKRDFGGKKDDIFNTTCIDQLEERYKFVNALLDYRFDPEIDKEYIQEKRRQAELWLHGGQTIMLKDNK